MKSQKIIVILLMPMLMAFVFSMDQLFVKPTYFPKPIYNFLNNPLTKEKIELGRVLFYDPLLSANNQISCASCHSPYNSFAHTDHDLSHGINDQIGLRNAPALMNLAWHSSFMWDGAVNHLDVQALAPITHPKEMGETINGVVSKLRADDLYKKLFWKAYRDSSITGEQVLKALSQFQLTLVSANSKYDRVKLGKERFTDQEKNGYQIFLKHCNSCHTEPLFSNYSYANNGLPTDTTLNDYGRYEVTKDARDSLKFKVPTLRNLSFTYPYMHDGRFKKLNQVINHYNNGITPGKTLSQELRSPIRLNSNEKTDLIAFLLTLDDKEFVFNERFAYPKEILAKAKEMKK